MPTFNKGIVHGQLSNEQITLTSLLPSCANYARSNTTEQNRTKERNKPKKEWKIEID